MSKYHTLVGIDPSGSQGLDIPEFIQQGDASDNVVYLYIAGDNDIPSLDYEDIPTCGHEQDDDVDDCECMLGEKLIGKVMKHYEDMGFNVSVINMGSFITSL